MRRLAFLIALALTLVLLALAPASADKPTCKSDDSHSSCKTDDPTPTTTTEPPAPEICVFKNGVLLGWEPPAPYRCQWTVPQEERDRRYQFSLQPVPDVEGATVNLPHLVVTDVYPSGGSWCINEHTVGWNDLPHAWNPFTLPADDDCSGPGGGLPGSTDGEDVFAITN